MVSSVDARSATRFVLRFRGDAVGPSLDIKRIRRSPNVRVLDDSSPRMLLVEAPEAELRAALKSDQWTIAPERSLRLPSDPRPRIRTLATKKR